MSDSENVPSVPSVLPKIPQETVVNNSNDDSVDSFNKSRLVVWNNDNQTFSVSNIVNRENQLNVTPVHEGSSYSYETLHEIDLKSESEVVSNDHSNDHSNDESNNELKYSAPPPAAEPVQVEVPADKFGTFLQNYNNSISNEFLHHNSVYGYGKSLKLSKGSLEVTVGVDNASKVELDNKNVTVHFNNQYEGTVLGSKEPQNLNNYKKNQGFSCWSLLFKPKSNKLTMQLV